MNWQKLTFENHPDFNKPVLVFGENTVLIARLHIIRMSLDSCSFDFLNDYTGLDEVYISVTHWMPLPERPVFGG